jgi:hypothetical protein
VAKKIINKSPAAILADGFIEWLVRFDRESLLEELTPGKAIICCFLA